MPVELQSQSARMHLQERGGNPFGPMFQLAAENVGATYRADGFDSSVIEVRLIWRAATFALDAALPCRDAMQPPSHSPRQHHIPHRPAAAWAKYHNRKPLRKVTPQGQQV
jgi:hypothetical protein